MRWVPKQVAPIDRTTWFFYVNDNEKICGEAGAPGGFAPSGVYDAYCGGVDLGRFMSQEAAQRAVEREYAALTAGASGGK